MNEKGLIHKMNDFNINGLKLPKSMINRIQNGQWKTPINYEKLIQLIRDKSPHFSEKEDIDELENMKMDFSLYDLELMEFEAKGLAKCLNQEYDKDRIMFLGKKDDKVIPGIIDVYKTILFADFGWGSDTPFALDYSLDENNPSIILLYWGDDPIKDNRWKKIANSFEEFEKIIWNCIDYIT